MVQRIERGLDGLIDHYAVASLVLAQFIMTLIGIGDVRTVSLAGLVLCLVGLAQPSARADFWILVPLILYSLIGMGSTYAVCGNIVDGYGTLHLVFPVLYLLIACLKREERLLLKRACAAWAGAVAAIGIGQFVFRAAVQGQGGRLGGLLGNPNAMGIFLVVGWFALMTCLPEKGETGPAAVLPCLEPVLLIALALTLSMGSFLAMAVGILVLLAGKKSGTSWKETACWACRLLGRVTLGVGTGVLIYLAAVRTDLPWSCVPLLVYGAAETALWRKLGRFMEAYPWVAALASAMGGAVALMIVAMRPSSVATFGERLEMMVSASRYLLTSPLLGVGPYQWRMLDLYDGGTYFNTWHIHNVLIHVGVEMGLAAMASLAVVAVRVFQKRREPAVKAGFTAFCAHNLMDTSFFYLGVTSLALISAADPQGWELSGWRLKAFFVFFAALFAISLFSLAGAV